MHVLTNLGLLEYRVFDGLFVFLDNSVVIVFARRCAAEVLDHLGLHVAEPATAALEQKRILWPHRETCHVLLRSE